MIKNEVNYCTMQELKNNINILLVDDETINIFLDGNTTSHMKDVMNTIYDTVDIDKKDHGSIESIYKAFDLFDEIFIILRKRDVRKVNLIVKNAQEHLNFWCLNGQLCTKHDVVNFYHLLVKRYEEDYPDLSRMSCDIYLCDEDFNINDYKTMVNFPSPKVVDRNLNKMMKLFS